MVLARLQKEADRLVISTQNRSWTSTLYREGEEIVANHGSASMREEAPHATETTQITISNALRRRAQAVINDTSIDPLETNEDVSDREKIEALIDMICGTGGPTAAGALFVLMGTLGNSAEPEALANAAKHFAFTHCGELNLYGMVDTHVAIIERELLAGNTLRS